MKISIATLINSTPIFDKLMNKELSPVTSFKLVKIVKAINEEMAVFEKEKIKLLEKYGKKNEDDSYTILDENKELWNKDISDLLSLEVDVVFDKINLADEDIKISPSEIMRIEAFIEM